MTDTTTATPGSEPHVATSSGGAAPQQPRAASLERPAADVPEPAAAASIAENLAKAVTETQKMVDRAAQVSRSGALSAIVVALGFLVCIAAPLTAMVGSLDDSGSRADLWVTDDVVIAGYVVGGVLILGGGLLALLGAVLPAKWISVAATRTADTVARTLTFEQRVAQRAAERQAAGG